MADQLVILDALGREVWREQLAGSSNTNVDVSAFPAGAYFARLIANDGTSHVAQMLVE